MSANQRVILSLSWPVIPSGAKDLLSFVRAHSAKGLLVISLASCSWFTDFKEQPKIDPWDSPNDSTPPRGNPQGSVSIYGTSAPEFAYGRTTQSLEQMSGLANPIGVDQASVDRGRISYQINCAVCHGPLGAGNGVVLKYGVYPPAINGGATAARSDGYIFAVIRNGKNLMPSYNRIEEHERWDVVNYVRTLQGRTGITADSTHGRPGETGALLPGASETAPTRPAPYYNQLGAQAGAREGLMGAALPGSMPGVKPAPRAATPDTTRPPMIIPVLPPAHRPPSPEARS